MDKVSNSSSQAQQSYTHLLPGVKGAKLDGKDGTLSLPRQSQQQ